MNTITQQAKEYANTSIEFFDSDGNPCVQPAFEAGANYVLDEIESLMKNVSDEYPRFQQGTIIQGELIELLKQLKQ